MVNVLRESQANENGVAIVHCPHSCIAPIDRTMHTFRISNALSQATLMRLILFVRTTVVRSNKFPVLSVHMNILQ